MKSKLILLCILFLLSFNIVYAEVHGTLDTDNLIAYYKLNVDETPQTDSSGNSVDCVRLGPPDFNQSCKLDQCYDFDTGNEFFNVTAITIPDKSLTASAWILSHNTGTTARIIEGGIVADNMNNDFSVQQISNGVRALCNDGAGGAEAVTNIVGISQDTWTMVSVTYDGSNCCVWVNNASSDCAAFSKSMPTNTGSRIGADFAGTSQFNGLIDHVTYWNHPMGTENFSTLYNDGNGLDMLAGGGDSTPPNAEYYNVTTAYVNSTAWNTGGQVGTEDSTPSIRIDIDEAGNVSYITSTNSTSIDCLTTDTQNHTCTIDAGHALIEGVNTVNFTFTDGTNSNSSGNLNIFYYVAPPNTELQFDSVDIRSHINEDNTVLNLSFEDNCDDALHTSEGYIGKGCAFTEGSTQYYDIPYNNNLNISEGGWTIEGWFKLNELDGWRDIIYKTQKGAALQVRNTNTIYGIAYNQTNSTISVTSTSAIESDTWYYVTLKLNNSGYLQLFINGQLNTTSASRIYNTQNLNQLTCIGGYWHAASGCVGRFNGTIDEIRIYNTALTPKVILEHYNNISVYFYNDTLGVSAVFNSTFTDENKYTNNDWRKDSVSIAVLNLDFNNETLRDRSSYSNNPSSTGATYNSNSYYGGGYDFDGITSYMNITDSSELELDNSVTFNFWVKHNDYGLYDRYFSKKNAGSTQYYMYVDDATNILWGYAGCTHGYYSWEEDLNWYMVTLVVDYDSNQMKLYKNATLVSTKNGCSFSMPAGTSNLQIGYGHQGAYFNGSIDEFKILNYSLSQQEINDLYNLNYQVQRQELSEGETWEAYTTVCDGTVCDTKSSSITIDNYPPIFEQDITGTYNIAHTIESLNLDVNCSDIEEATLSYYDNTSLFNIDSSTGIITDTPSYLEFGTYNIKITCGDGIDNSTQTITYNITNQAPTTVYARINPTTTVLTNQSILGYCNGTDSEGVLTYVYEWYYNYNSNVSGNVSSMTSGVEFNVYNITPEENQNWTLSCRVFDGIVYGDWKNSTTVLSYAHYINITDYDVDTGINNLTLDVATNDLTNISIGGAITYTNSSFLPINNITVTGLNPNTIYTFNITLCNAASKCNTTEKQGMTKTRINITASKIISNVKIADFNVTLNVTYNGSNNEGFFISTPINNLTSIIIGGDIHSTYNITWNSSVVASGYVNTNTSLGNNFLATTQDSYEAKMWSAILNVTAKKLDGTNISAFNITLSSQNWTYIVNKKTTTGWVAFETILEEYNLTFKGSGYATNSTIYDVESLTYYNYTFYVFTGESLNIDIYDEITGDQFTNTSPTVTIEFIHDDQSFNISVNNGSVYRDGLSLGEWKLVYYADGYDRRYYYTYITNGSCSGVKLYLLNSTESDALVVTVIDENDAAVPNAVVQILRYYLTTNSYNIVEMGKTNDEGKTPLWVELYDADYKFIVKSGVPGTVWHNGIGQKLTSLTYRINVNKGDSTLYSFWITRNPYTNLNYSTTTNSFYYTWSTLGGNVIEGCLKVIRETGTSSETVCDSCSISATSAIVCSLNDYINKSGVFYAEGRVDTDSENSWVITDSMSYGFGSAISYFGAMGAFIALLIVLVLAFSSLWNPYVAIVGSLVGLVAVFMLGIVWTAAGTVYLMGIVFIGIIILITGKTG